MGHIENVYRLSCELRVEFSKSLDGRVVNSRAKKYDAALSDLADWALANLRHDKDISEDSDQEGVIEK